MKQIFKWSEQKLREHLPQIKTYIEEHVVPRLKRVFTDDDELRRVLSITHRFVPFYIRFAIPKDKFIDFVLRQKHAWFPQAGEPV